MQKSPFFTLCLLFFLFGLEVCSAQSWDIGIKGGISIPNLTSGGSVNNPLNTGYKSILGADGAVFAQYGVTKVFSLELSVEYSKQGGQKNGNQALPTPEEVSSQYPPGSAPPYLWATFDGKANLDYLLIPVLGKFTFKLASKSPLKWYVDAGPFVGFILSAKTVTSGTSNVYLDQGQTQPLLPGPIPLDATTDIKSQLHSANFGIEGNLGLAYCMDRYSIFVEGGGNYGFVPIQKDASNGQNHTGAAVARIGFSYSLDK
jgi:hypothetical protein